MTCDFKSSSVTSIIGTDIIVGTILFFLLLNGCIVPLANLTSQINRIDNKLIELSSSVHQNCLNTTSNVYKCQ